MRSGKHHQAAILPVDMLHGCPGAHDVVCWAEWEVVEVCNGGVGGGGGGERQVSQSNGITPIDTNHQFLVECM